jgi:hypothetical protein
VLKLIVVILFLSAYRIPFARKEGKGKKNSKQLVLEYAEERNASALDFPDRNSRSKMLS